MLDYLTSSLVTLYVVADPLLLSALFLGLTHGMSESERREVAWGITGRAVSTRMLGIILAALAVQFMIDGVMELAGAS